MIFEWKKEIGMPVSMKLSCKSVKKWMRLAKSVRDVENPCYSRSIGTLIVDPDANAIISTGHNGPPSGCPSNDDPDYLKDVVWPQLTTEEKNLALNKCKYKDSWTKEVDLFVVNFGNCKVCPRKHIDAPSGKRLELCNCIHGEVDAVCKAKASGGKLFGSYMFCYCGVPCIECSKVIINSGLDVVFAIDHGKGDYSPYSSRWLFEKSRVSLILIPEEWFWED